MPIITVNEVKEKAKVKEQAIETAVLHLENQAQKNGYLGIYDLCMDAMSTDPEVKAIGEAGVAFKNNVKAVMRQIVRDFNQGSRPKPTRAEVLAELPTLTLP